MTPHEWCEKWCTELDGAMEKAHMALKEAGYPQARLERGQGLCHAHLYIAWKSGGPTIPQEVERRAYQLSMSPEMYEEAIKSTALTCEAITVAASQAVRE